MRFLNFITKDPLDYIGKTASFFASWAFGAGASGFIVAASKMFGFDPAAPTAPLWGTILLYSGAGIVGLNGAYRMWRVTKEGSIAGLKMIFEKNDNALQENLLLQEVASSKKISLKRLGIGLSFFAGATYGGVAYLGISEIIASGSTALQVSSGVVTISSVFVAAGSLFSCAWLNQIKSGTLFIKHKQPKSKVYIAAEIASALLTLYGLGTIMELGSLGLARSVSSAMSQTSSKILGSCIAFVGFLGEAPFSIQQGRLVVKKLAKNVAQPPVEVSGDQKRTSYAEVLSTVMYANGYLFGSIASIDLPAAGKVTSAIGASYLAVVSSLIDDIDDDAESDQSLLPNETPIINIT